MFALILDSLGGTELLFILAIALIFFGPRKLPQLARSMGKGLAEFRKASDDFKRTWEREVSLESARTEPGDNAILNPESSSTSAYETAQPVNEPLYQPADSDLVVARQSPHQTSAEVSPPVAESSGESGPEPLRKHDWV